MAVTLHCQHCGKKISAKEQLFGKWAKCPACHNEIYIPEPVPEDDSLPLKPLDPEDLKRKKELMVETYKLTSAIQGETSPSSGSAASEPPDSPSAAVSGGMKEKDLSKCIINYLRSIADSDLSRADALMEKIAANSGTALKIIDRIAVSEVPESGLEDIPPQVVSALIRELRVSISS